jgi:hypothetical protein
MEVCRNRVARAVPLRSSVALTSHLVFDASTRHYDAKVDASYTSLLKLENVYTMLIHLFHDGTSTNMVSAWNFQFYDLCHNERPNDPNLTHSV